MKKCHRSLMRTAKKHEQLFAGASGFRRYGDSAKYQSNSTGKIQPRLAAVAGLAIGACVLGGSLASTGSASAVSGWASLSWAMRNLCRRSLQG